MNKNEAEEGRAWFTFLISLPSLLAWVAYGLAWLLGPHFAVQPEPLTWAAYAVATYYAIVITVTIGPLIFAGL